METLKKLDRWCTVNLQTDASGKVKKIPINPKTGTGAQTNDINTFTDFKTAHAYSQQKKSTPNVGFLVCTQNDSEKLVGIDLDHVVHEDGSVSDWAQEIVNAVDSYTEVSVSGTGLHIICRGEIKDNIKNKIKVTETEELEIYGRGTGGRYFCMTLQPYQNRNVVKEISQDKLHAICEKYKMLKADTGERMQRDESEYKSKLADNEVITLITHHKSSKVCKLWRNEKLKASDSEDEAALVMYLLYYCGGDTEQVERLMYKSDRATDERVEKWGTKHSGGGATYLEMTIDNAYNSWDGSVHPRQKTFSVLSDECYFDAYIDDVTNVNNDYIETCFPRLNNLLGGGLYAGLYVIGAVSSLGKTTFALQLCDSLIKQKQDVLVISLEMSRAELTSKRLSRMTAEQALSQKGGESLAKTARQISNGRLYCEYSSDEVQVIEQAKQTYKLQLAPHIYTVEGDGAIGIAEVRQIATGLEQQLGHAPVILIDYLQILAPTNPKGTDKQNTDAAIVGCKTLSRDLNTPVIVISSSNRASYNGKASLAQFKESGTIEYSADVAIGLIFTGAGTSDFDETTARAAAERDITLSVMKNRNGALGDIQYKFYAPYNYFTECDLTTKDFNSWQKKKRQ